MNCNIVSQWQPPRVPVAAMPSQYLRKDLHVHLRKDLHVRRELRKVTHWRIFAIALAAFLLPWAPLAWGQTDARILLEKGSTRVELYRPGTPENYRGARFDHSGMFHAISYQGKSLCQRWHSGAPNPDANDDVTGPCEEFGNGVPLGYEKGKPGSKFLKIGVGLMIQPNESDYKFMTPYQFAVRGKWETTATPTTASFEQTLVDKDRPKPIGYRYLKTIEVQADGFTIYHRLTNLGDEEIVTDHYNHNFFLLDGQLVDSSYEVDLNFKIEPQQVMSAFADVVKVEGKSLKMKDNIGGQSYFARLDGHQNRVEDHRFVLRNKKSGLQIECFGDRELHKFNFWGLRNTICPEPYVLLKIPTKETAEWTLTYRISQK